MDNPNGVLRTGDRATVQFEFISNPEYLKEGMKLLFREGKTKVRRTHRSCACNEFHSVFAGTWCDNETIIKLFYSFFFLGWLLLHRFGFRSVLREPCTCRLCL